MQDMLAGYACQADPETFMRKWGSQVPNDIARLSGVRFLAANETTKNRHLNEPLVKQLTGGDKATARFLYKEFFEFVPQFKVFLSGNHRPRLETVDFAIRRRIHLIPFTQSFTGKHRDPGLLGKLKDELPGILNWVVQGCLNWQRKKGLDPPKVVQEETAGYLDDQDCLSKFFNERCVSNGDGLLTKFSVIYDAYKKWAAENGTNFTLSEKAFAKELESRGFHSTKRSDGHYRRGIGLKEGK